PKPSVQPTLSRAFVEHFVEPCGFWPFSTKWADKVHDKGPRTPFVGQALTRPLHLEASGARTAQWVKRRKISQLSWPLMATPPMPTSSNAQSASQPESVDDHAPLA